MTPLETVSLTAFILGIALRDYYVSRAARRMRQRIERLERLLLPSGELVMSQDTHGAAEFVAPLTTKPVGLCECVRMISGSWAEEMHMGECCPYGSDGKYLAKNNCPKCGGTGRPK